MTLQWACISSGIVCPLRFSVSVLHLEVRCGEDKFLRGTSGLVFFRTKESKASGSSHRVMIYIPTVLRSCLAKLRLVLGKIISIKEVGRRSDLFLNFDTSVKSVIRNTILIRNKALFKTICCKWRNANILKYAAFIP